MKLDDILGQHGFRAGIYCVGVGIGNHGTQNINHADLVVATLKELI